MVTNLYCTGILVVFCLFVFFFVIKDTDTPGTMVHISILVTKDAIVGQYYPRAAYFGSFQSHVSYELYGDIHLMFMTLFYF